MFGWFKEKKEESELNKILEELGMEPVPEEAYEHAVREDDGD